jgi:hypothetical protein
MRENLVRISFDVPAEEHHLLKLECLQAHVSIKEFMQEVMRKGLQELKEKQLQERLKKSVKQAKEGKVKSRDSFAKYIEDEV